MSMTEEKALSGSVCAKKASKLLGAVKRVEINAFGSDGSPYTIRMFKGEALTFLKDHPNIAGELNGETLLIQL